jgi:hypothetical protein
MSWSDEEIAILRECVDNGMSFAEAMRTINTKFRTSYSRNAVIGKALRLGIRSKDTKPATHRGPMKKTYRPRVPKITLAQLSTPRAKAIPIEGRAQRAWECQYVLKDGTKCLRDCRGPYCDIHRPLIYEGKK